MRQDFQRTSGQGHQNFPSRHHQKEKCWDLLTPPRCQVFQVKSQVLQSSLSIATECWILERRLARGFIPNPSSRKTFSFIRRASCRPSGRNMVLSHSGPVRRTCLRGRGQKGSCTGENTHTPGHHFTPTGPTGFNEEQSVHASTGSVVYVQTGFQQRLSISFLDEPSRQGTMPSKRSIVETVHRGNELNKKSRLASPDPHTVPQTKGQQIDPASRTDRTRF